MSKDDVVVVCPVCEAELVLSLEGKGASRKRKALLGKMFRVPASERRLRRQVSPHSLGIVPGAAEEWREVRFTKPSRQPTVPGDVIVPLGQAIVSAVIAGVLAAIPVVRWGWDWVVIPAVGIGTLAAVWSWRLADLSGLLREMEEYLGQDLDGDGIVGPIDEVKIMVHQKAEANLDDEAVESGDQVRYVRLPFHSLHPQIFRAMPQDNDEGKWPRQWSRSGLQGVAGLSEPQAEQLLSAMREAGFLRWRGGNVNDPRGSELTPSGRAYIRRVLESGG